MADGGLTIELDGELAEQVKAEAAARGIAVEAYLREALAAHLEAHAEWSDDLDPAIDERIADEMLERGDGISWSAFRERLRAFGRPPA